jgi:hypothetical protein
MVLGGAQARFEKKHDGHFGVSFGVEQRSVLRVV